jgi:hypothetical protein
MCRATGSFASERAQIGRKYWIGLEHDVEQAQDKRGGSRR